MPMVYPRKFGAAPKIFGELMQLIEADYRDKSIKLAYNKSESFFVPGNVHLIGMMNTADRSLAMIDYALRRRFSFFKIKPGFDSNGFTYYRTKLVDSELLDKLTEAVKQVNDMIANDDSLGEGFLIGHSYLYVEDSSKPRFDRSMTESVIEYDIIPLLEEYWFDNHEKLNSAIQILRDVLK